MGVDAACVDDFADRYRFITLMAYFLFAVGPLIGNSVLSLLGAIATDFLVDPTNVLVAIPAFMFPFAVFQLFSGALSDIYGRVPVIIAGLFGLTVGLGLIVISTTIEIFALGNFISGIGFGFVNSVLLALLSDCAPPEDIPKRMGIASALASFSVGLGPFIAGQMVILGWQSYYFLFLAVVVLGMIGISVVNRPPKIVVEGSGIRALIQNLGIELRKPTVLLMLITSFLVALAYLGTLVWTSRGLTGHIDEGLIGLILLGGGIAGALAGSMLGRIIRRGGSKLPLMIGIILILIGTATLFLIPDITAMDSLAYVQIGIILVAAAGGLLFPSMITFSQMLSPERRGVLAGAVTCATFLGSAVIPMVYDPLFSLGMQVLYLGIIFISVIMSILLATLYRSIMKG